MKFIFFKVKGKTIPEKEASQSKSVSTDSLEIDNSLNKVPLIDNKIFLKLVVEVFSKSILKVVMD